MLIETACRHVASWRVLSHTTDGLPTDTCEQKTIAANNCASPDLYLYVHNIIATANDACYHRSKPSKGGGGFRWFFSRVDCIDILCQNVPSKHTDEQTYTCLQLWWAKRQRWPKCWHCKSAGNIVIDWGLIP